MPRLDILTKSEQNKYESCPNFKEDQRQYYFLLDNELHEYVVSMINPINKIGFVLQLGYFRYTGKFFANNKYYKKDIKYVTEFLKLSDLNIDIESYTYKNRNNHQKFILKYLNWKKFNKTEEQKLKSQVQWHATQQLHPKQLFFATTQYLVNNKVEFPSYYLLSDIITEAYNNAEKVLIDKIKINLTPFEQETLEELICIDDRRRKDHKFSQLSFIKNLRISTKIKDIEDFVIVTDINKQYYQRFYRIYQTLSLSDKATKFYATWVKKI